MSKLEELISELCPDGVEYKTLDQIAENHDNERKPITSRNRESGQYPYYGASGIVDYVKDYIFDGDFLLISEDGANLITRNTPITFSISGKNWVNNHAHILRFDSIITQKFVEYYLESLDLTAFISGAAQPKLNQKNLNKIPIPFPPLPVQSEIVCILDNFTELTAELTAELRAELAGRKKQYEYYMDELFGKDYDEMLKRCFQNNIKVITLEKLGKFIRGKRFVRNDIKEEGIPCIHYGDLYTYYGVSAEKTKYFLDKELSEKMRFAHKGDVVIVQAGENDMDIGIGVAWMGNEDVAVHDACYIFEHNINPKYISHYLRTNIYHLQIKKYVSTGKICSISAQGIGKALIPVPPLVEQERIVAILDRYNIIVNDIIQDLIAEIETRKKQYEYYRDKLLTFKEIKK